MVVATKECTDDKRAVRNLLECRLVCQCNWLNKDTLSQAVDTNHPEAGFTCQYLLSDRSGAPDVRHFYFTELHAVMTRWFKCDTFETEYSIGSCFTRRFCNFYLGRNMRRQNRSLNICYLYTYKWGEITTFCIMRLVFNT